MTPPPRRALVFHLGGIEFVLRPGGVVLFSSIAAALDVTFLPLALPGAPALTYHLIAAALALLMIVTTLLHESGHAIAYRVQGIWPVRITLRGSGGACAAMVYEDTPARALVRALAGPAVSLLVVLTLIGLWRLPVLPPVCRLLAATLTVFSLGDLVFNTLPFHPRCDGTHALRSLLWILRGREPERFAVLYLWRPTILAAAILALGKAASALPALPYSDALPTVAACIALALCAVPLGTMVWRYLSLRRPAAA